MTKKRSIEDRFWEKVDIRGDYECWEWQARKDPDGYGRFAVDRKNRKSPRVAWVLVYGEIPGDLCVCHRCDCPSCCNPRHLFLASHRGNMRDMAIKERSGGTILTGSQVVEIRRLWSETDLRQWEIGEMFGVTQVAISAIVTGKNWAHI